MLRRALVAAMAALCACQEAAPGTVPFDPNDGDQDIGLYLNKGRCLINDYATWWRFDGELDWTECKCSKGRAFRGSLFSGFDSSAAGCLQTTETGEEVAVIKLWARTFQCEGDATYTSSTEDAESNAIINGRCGSLTSPAIGIGYGKLEAPVHGRHAEPGRRRCPQRRQRSPDALGGRGPGRGRCGARRSN